MIDKEDWLPVRGYENNYLVSSLGRIKAIKQYWEIKSGKRFSAITKHLRK